MNGNKQGMVPAITWGNIVSRVFLTIIVVCASVVVVAATIALVRFLLGGG